MVERAGIAMNFTLGKASKPKPTTSSDTPFRMLVIGDFGGHHTRGEQRVAAELRPQRVDIDSFPSLFGRIAPKVQIQLGDQAPFVIPIDSLDAFHPDQLYGRHAFFAPMRELRKQLQDPKSFAMAAAMLGKLGVPVAEPVVASPAEHGEDLQRLLGRPASEPARPPASTATSAVDGLIRQAVAPHVVGKSDPRQADLVSSVDGMTGELMRAVLHDPGFQQVESVWRGLDRLLRSLDLDESLQVFVLDVSRDELTADFAGAASLAESAMHRIVVDHGGATPWSLLVDCNAYGRRQEDAALLARLGTIAQSVDAAVLAGIDHATWSNGFPSQDDERAWIALRSSPAATAVGVAAPSILMRLPYGKDTDPTEGFVFAEQSTPPTPSRYLWGTSAIALAQLLGQSFRAADGWDFSPGDESTLDDLPTHVSRQDGESVQTPCAQVWLPESKLDAMIKDGLIPMVSAQGRGEVRVARFQSIASPPAGLAGRWANG
jgi:type VI secretion system protein ImpC